VNNKLKKGKKLMFSVLINWFKEVFLRKDTTLIGLSQLKENNIPKKNVTQEVSKTKKDIKISDLIKGEIY
jgi:hypothetical protein